MALRDKRLLAAFFLALACFFLIANRGAYKGYFYDDDLDNLSLTRELHWADFFTPLAVPRVFANNFRPMGHLFYKIMAGTANLHYTPYIFFIHGLHLLNVLLLWFVLRRLGLPWLAACAGSLFWAFHMAAFDVYWRPMYVFDLLCGCFCLLSLLAYLKDRWILALVAMWIGYRSKEIAVMLPVVFTAYELFLGQKRWNRLLPFWALSILIGIQAVIQNLHRDEAAYVLHADPANVWKCIEYYAGLVFLVPYAGFAVLALLLIPDRRVRFGVVTFCALLLPMLLLPGRLFNAYMYVPLIGLSIALAAIATKLNPAIVAGFFLIWLPWNYINLRLDRRAALAEADDRRKFVTSLVAFSGENPGILTFIYDHGPLRAYGTQGAIKLAHPVGAPLRFTTVESDDLLDALKADSLVVANWDPQLHKPMLLVRRPDTPDVSYIHMHPTTPIWQLREGWYGLEQGFRWTKPYAVAELSVPPDAKKFELVVNIGPQYIEKVPRSHVVVSLDGTTIGECDFTRAAWQTVRWDLKTKPIAARTQVTIRVSPALHLDRDLGIAVVGFGFVI